MLFWIHLIKQVLQSLSLLKLLKIGQTKICFTVKECYNILLVLLPSQLGLLAACCFERDEKQATAI